jgi:hypothetical protein
LLSFNHPDILLIAQGAALWIDGSINSKRLKINKQKKGTTFAFWPGKGLVWAILRK